MGNAVVARSGGIGWCRAVAVGTVVLVVTGCARSGEAPTATRPDADPGRDATATASATSAATDASIATADLTGQTATACNDVLGFCVDYLASWSYWSQGVENGSVLFSNDPDAWDGLYVPGGLKVVVEVLENPARAPFEDWLAARIAAFPTWRIASGAREITVSGRRAVQQIEDFRDADGTHPGYAVSTYVDRGEHNLGVVAMALGPEDLQRHREGHDLMVRTLDALGAPGCLPLDAGAARSGERATQDGVTLLTGRCFGYVRGIEAFASGPARLEVDIAQWLTGTDAGAAAVADGVIERPDALPNGFHIRNRDPETYLLQLPPETTVKTLGPTGAPEAQTVDMAELVALFDDDADAEARWMRDMPFWITVENGVVASVEMQYLP